MTPGFADLLPSLPLTRDRIPTHLIELWGDTVFAACSLGWASEGSQPVPSVIDQCCLPHAEWVALYGADVPRMGAYVVNLMLKGICFAFISGGFVDYGMWCSRIRDMLGTSDLQDVDSRPLGREMLLAACIKLSTKLAFARETITKVIDAVSRDSEDALRLRNIHATTIDDPSRIVALIVGDSSGT